MTAMLPPNQGDLVRARSVYKHRALPVRVLLLLRFARHGRFGLCLLFLPEFLVTGFPAVGDLGQELADVFDFGLGPDVNGALSLLHRLRSWNLSYDDIVRKSPIADSEFLCCLSSG
jgi:hypothetical protein